MTHTVLLLCISTPIHLSTLALEVSSLVARQSHAPVNFHTSSSPHVKTQVLLHIHHRWLTNSTWVSAWAWGFFFFFFFFSKMSALSGFIHMLWAWALISLATSTLISPTLMLYPHGPVNTWGPDFRVHFQPYKCCPWHFLYIFFR